MTSIRRATLIGMAGLLILAMGSVCYLVYRTCEHSLAEKHEAARKVSYDQYEDKRDEAILVQARTFAALAQLETKEDQVNRLFATSIQFDESQLSRMQEAIEHEYLQISADSREWRSETLTEPDLRLQAPDSAIDPFGHKFTNAELQGRSIRMVTLKVPLTHFVRIPPPTSRELLGYLGGATAVNAPLIDLRRSKTAFRVLGGGLVFPQAVVPGVRPMIPMGPMGGQPGPQMGGGGGGRFPPRSLPLAPPRQPSVRNSPMVFIQVAWVHSKEHPSVRTIMERHEEELNKLEADSRRSLSELRKNLWLVGAFTLLAALLGGYAIIGTGLRPLRKLSHAVSQVSEKDFNLQVNAAEMPVEVRPTVERLQSTLNQLKRAFEREKQATADISHELRTPIASLNTTLEVALKKPRTEAQYREVLTDCRAIGKQMGGMVERIMALAYMDAGADRTKDENVDAHELLSGCAAVGKPLAEAHGLKFHSNLGGDLHVQTDPDKLREVVMNLLHNAIEYNTPGGEVTLSAKHTAPNGLQVDVRDTGIGIAPEIKERIFERFYRADPSRQQTGVHAGLGLAIVKEYVERLGGTLELESQVGAGSRFRLRIPGK